jgi:hypothetical protein
MTANIEVVRQPPRPRPASRHRDAILTVVLLAAAARSARLAEAARSQISRGPDEPLPSPPVSRQRAAILIVVVLAGAADLVPVALSLIALAALRALVRDSQIFPRALSWYFGPVSTWHIRRLKRRYLRRQMLDAPTG